MEKLIFKSEAFLKPLSFGSAAQALEFIKSHDPDIPEVILLDINMPKMDGWEFLNKLKAVKPAFCQKARIFIVSSSIALEDKKNAEMFQEIEAYIAKPMNVAGLKRIAFEEKLE